MWLDKCLESPVSEDPWTSEMVKGPKDSWNMHDSNFARFIAHSENNWGGRSLS